MLRNTPAVLLRPVAATNASSSNNQKMFYCLVLISTETKGDLQNPMTGGGKKEYVKRNGR